MDTQSIQNRSKKLSHKFPTEIPNEVVENQTQKIPNLVFLGLAGASVLGSLILAVRRNEKTDLANFVGHWAPTFLMLGLYNKIVKLENELLEQSEHSRELH